MSKGRREYSKAFDAKGEYNSAESLVYGFDISVTENDQ
jgi:hypothetical protein